MPKTAGETVPVRECYSASISHHHQQDAWSSFRLILGLQKDDAPDAVRRCWSAVADAQPIAKEHQQGEARRALLGDGRRAETGLVPVSMVILSSNL